MAIQTIGFAKIYLGFIFVCRSEEIPYLFLRNFAPIQVLRENGREFVRAKIFTNKVMLKATSPV